MSVVNKMLNDLEQRQGAPTVDAIYHPPKASYTRFIVWALVLILLIVGLVVGYQWLDNEATGGGSVTDDNQPPTPSVVVPANAPAAMAVTQEIKNSPAEPISKDDSAIVDDVAMDTLGEDATLQSEVIEKPMVNAKPVASSQSRMPVTVKSDTATELNSGSKQVALESSFSLSTVKLNEEQHLEQVKQHIQMALAQGDKDLAITKLNELLEKQPSHSKGRQKLASLLHEQGKTALAEKVLRNGLVLAHEDSQQRLMLARLLLAQNQPEHALNLLLQLQPQVDEHIDYYGLIADVARQLNNNELALTTYGQLVTHAPSNARWWLGQAISADQMAKADVARSAYQQALELRQLDQAVSEFIRQRLSVIGG